jgi:hypothetical protein
MILSNPLEPHPFAALFPELPSEEFTQLARDIKERRQLEPIIPLQRRYFGRSESLQGLPDSRRENLGLRNLTQEPPSEVRRNSY